MYKTENVEIERKRHLPKGVYVRSGRCGCLYSDNWAKAMGLECALGLPRGRMRSAEPHDCEKMGV